MFRIIKTFPACSSGCSSSTSCSSNGECTCKTNVVGIKCTVCESGYFGFPNCQGKTFQKLNCHKILGQLNLLQNVDVTSLDPLQNHVIEVVCVLAKQMLMAPNV